MVCAKQNFKIFTTINWPSGADPHIAGDHDQVCITNSRNNHMVRIDLHVCNIEDRLMYTRSMQMSMEAVWDAIVSRKVVGTDQIEELELV